ncbi:MAG: SIS domain-containing protein, partial [Candidatus Thermoplasmatota archaeon]
TLAIVVSQSGETADSLEALRKARGAGCRTLAIVNVAGSSLAREAEGVFFLRAGPEIGVASTKAFINTLGAFNLLGLHLARVRGTMTAIQVRRMLGKLEGLPLAMERVCAREDELRKIAEEMFTDATDAFFLGRQLNYGLALEGALKLKEISYIHAEGYAAGELKHGPLALVQASVPIVALVSPSDASHAVMLSNIMEVRARGGKVLGLICAGDVEATHAVDRAFSLPSVDPLHFPVPASVALYLLSYHVALARGCAIDKPRNLAKSVTVE